MTTLSKTQISNSEVVKSILKKVDTPYELSDGRSVETLLVYLPCKNGTCEYSAFFEIIKKNLMASFVFSCKQIEEKLSLRQPVDSEYLFKKAVRKLSEHTAQGELGELILFTLLEVYLEAPKILSKISLKTARRVAVFGADAVHAKYENGKLKLFLGESKLHQKFSSAATSAVDSITNILEKYQDELDLVDTHIDFPGMDAGAREALLEILNPFSDNEVVDPDILHSPCFIGFADPNVFCDDEDKYISTYEDVAAHHIGDFYRKLENKNNDINKTVLMLLPFSNLGKLTSEFVDYMGIEI